MKHIETHIIDIPRAQSLAGAVTSGEAFSSPEKYGEMPITVGKKEYTIIQWGSDNQLPYQIRDKIERNSVMSQNKFFNTLTCYGRGLEYMDRATMGDKTPMPTQDNEIRIWLMRNRLKMFFAEQVVDLKYYFFTVAVIILNRNRKLIVNVVHKDASQCRFEKADKQTGRPMHVFYADWKDNNNPDDIEVIPLLDERDPWGDLMARTGHRDYVDSDHFPDKECKYALVCKIPTPGCQYYPIPAYSAVFRDGWYDIYGLLTAAKKAKIKNGQNIRYHVEINVDFWTERARSKGITIGSDEYVEMKNQFIENLKRYFAGSENSDKLIWSEFEALLDGKEKHYIKINTVDTSKAGNEYNDDVAEAANVLCYDDNVHPNLAGATPGKSQMNNSGSDKRELFTMKQALETLSHDVLMQVHQVIVWFNGWQDKVVPVVPMILLTTLDKNTDAKEANMNNEPNSQNDGDTE